MSRSPAEDWMDDEEHERFYLMNPKDRLKWETNQKEIRLKKKTSGNDQKTTSGESEKDNIPKDQ